MKSIINKIQLSILMMSLASTVALSQITRDSVRTNTTGNQSMNSKMDSTKTRVASKTDSTKSKIAMGFDSTKTKVAAKIDTIKKDVKVAVDKVIDKVTPDKPKEVATIGTPNGGVVLKADPTNAAVFHKGSLVVGAGFVYQKDLLPLMLVGEYGIGRNIGVEVRTWYGGKTKDGVQYKDGLVGVGLNYHFTGDVKRSSKKFDAYVGGLFGKVLDDKGSALYAQAGARYFFLGRLGAFTNFNLGLLGSRGTNLSIGLAYNLF